MLQMELICKKKLNARNVSKCHAGRIQRRPSCANYPTRTSPLTPHFKMMSFMIFTPKRRESKPSVAVGPPRVSTGPLIARPLLPEPRPSTNLKAKPPPSLVAAHDNHDADGGKTTPHHCCCYQCPFPSRPSFLA
jgi:hypothetical protein